MTLSPVRVPVLATLVALLLVGGCATPARRTVQVPLELPDTFSGSGATARDARWWTAFGDADLDALVDEALRASPTLRAAWARLARADAVARRAGAPGRPALDALADVSRTRRKTAVDTPFGIVRDTNDTWDVGLALRASYELDLWGRIDAEVEAAAIDARTSAADLRTLAITLSARVADAWFRWREQLALVDLLARQIVTDESTLELIDARFRRGRVPAEDVLRQRQLIEAKRGQQATAREEADVLALELDVLLGRAPGTGTLPRRPDLPDPPPAPETGTPAGLMRRRPDVRAAFLAVQAADARTAAAAADRFPRVRLTGDLGTSAEAVDELFRGWFVSLAAGLTAPLLDGGSRDAEVERNEALVEERLQDLAGTVLVALQEVETALVRERRQAENLVSLEAQLELARQVVERTRDRYLGGATDYLRVLDALASSQALERGILAARRRRLQHRIELHRALAGGWPPEPPQPDGETPTE